MGRRKRVVLEEGAEIEYDEETEEILEMRLTSDSTTEEILVKLREGGYDEKLPRKVREALEEKLEEELGSY